MVGIKVLDQIIDYVKPLVMKHPFRKSGAAKTKGLKKSPINSQVLRYINNTNTLGNNNKKSSQKQDPIEKRWIEIGLDPALMKNDYESAKFLINKRLVYFIVGFQNTTADGPDKNAIRLNADGKMMIKKEGIWTPVSQIAQELVGDGSYNLLVNKNNRKEGWNYISPAGLVPFDRYASEEFYPIEQLSADEMETLRAHANAFAPADANPKGVSPKKCVLQLVMDPRKVTSRDESFVCKNLAANFPVHAAIRVISEDGKVYSTGFGSNQAEDKFNVGWSNYLASINGVPTILDYEEFRKHEGRLVTSIPIDEEACKSILTRLQEYRQDTIRFNIMHQNCTKMALNILDLAGVHVNNRRSVKEVLWSIIPNGKDIPIIGTTIEKIRNTVKRVFQAMADVTPAPVKIAFHAVKQTVLFIPNKIMNFSLNIALILLGARRGSPLPKHSAEIEKNSQNKPSPLRTFLNILPSLKEMFNDDALYMYHSLPVMQWMLQQNSTIVHNYAADGKPSMNILPEVTDQQKNRNKACKAYWEKRLLVS